MCLVPDLSILIINWRSVEFLEKCLASIYQNSRGVSLEVIVLDNASFDGSADMIERRFTEVRFIQGEKNIGFAQANNIAYASSRGRYILFLNPDTEVQGGALRGLVSCLNSFPKVGIAGPRLLNSDGTLQTSCIQAYPTLINQVFDAEILRRLSPGSTLWGIRALYESRGEPVKVQAVSGACLLVRREAFAEVGEFTSAYFMYSEDLDLCYKVQCAGWDIVHLGSVEVIHHGGQSSNRESQTNFATVMMRESLYCFMKIRRGTMYALMFRLAMAAVALPRLILLGAAYLVTLEQSRRSSLRAAMFKWRSVFRWTIGLEGWARQMAKGCVGDQPGKEWKPTHGLST